MGMDLIEPLIELLHVDLRHGLYSAKSEQSVRWCSTINELLPRRLALLALSCWLLVYRTDAGLGSGRRLMPNET